MLGDVTGPTLMPMVDTRRSSSSWLITMYMNFVCPLLIMVCGCQLYGLKKGAHRFRSTKYIVFRYNYESHKLSSVLFKDIHWSRIQKMDHAEKQDQDWTINCRYGLAGLDAFLHIGKDSYGEGVEPSDLGLAHMSVWARKFYDLILLNTSGPEINPPSLPLPTSPWFLLLSTFSLFPVLSMALFSSSSPWLELGNERESGTNWRKWKTWLKYIV